MGLGDWFKGPLVDWTVAKVGDLLSGQFEPSIVSSDPVERGLSQFFSDPVGFGAGVAQQYFGTSTVPSTSQIPTLQTKSIGTNPVPTIQPPQHIDYSETGKFSGATGMWGDPGWPNGLSMTTTGPRRILPFQGVVPSGYRVARRPARAPQAGYPAGVYLVPRRTMNVLNPRALMRAERRMSGFTKWVNRHFRIAKASPKRRRFGKKKGCR